MEILLLIIGLLVGVGLGWLIGRARPSSNGGADASTELASVRLTHANELGEIRVQLAAATAKAEQLTEQLQVERQSRAELIEQHRVEREQREQTEREEAKVLEKLAPVGDVVNKMQAKLDELQSQQTKQTTEIQTQLKNSLEVSTKLSESTQSLSRVMSNSALRGSWGELQLERVAELAGLHKGVNYILQKTVDGEDNRGRPDMTVYLSGNAAIAIDAKAPFAAYNEAMADVSSPEQRKQLLAKHAKDLRGHVQSLAQRDYAKNLEGKVDYVICFVPADSMLSAALEADPELLEYAISKKVVLASPTSLVAVLRPVAITWVQVENAQRANEIVEMGRELYSRLSTMASHAAKLGKSIQSSATSYNSFVSSLETRVLAQARRFDKLNASDLPEIEAIDGTVNLFNTEELRGMNAALDEAQPAIGAPVDVEAIAIDVEIDET
ncbi:MAG: DNA recombination protein RmuC [Agromyces sp.]